MQKAIKVVKANPLWFSFLFPMLTDGVVTLVGQAPSYWQHNSRVNEMGPAYFLLAAHPLVYVGGGVCYLVFCCWLVSRLKHPLNIMLAMALTIGHSWGSSTWLSLWLSQAGFMETRSLILLQWSFLVAYFVLVAICVGISFARYMSIRQETVAREI
jgi:hypothetical protein